jgi:ribonuclease-3
MSFATRLSRSCDVERMSILRGVARALRLTADGQHADLESAIGYRFKDRSLLSRAITHRSRSGRRESNERLELLGDAVLGLVSVEYLLKMFPGEDEGTLTKRRSYLVSRGYLARRARDLRLEQYVRLGKGERGSGLSKLPSVGANTVEALLGAVYLDGGIAAARRVVSSTILTEDSLNGWEEADPKSALQELAQRRGGSPPTYIVTGEQGPQHRKTFRVEVRVNGTRVGTGVGRSKKQAQRAAARAALEQCRGT